jgi:predicted GIY-YIG superfamily endonuclease
MTDNEQYLYRHFDKDDTLLYIGVSLNPFKRLNDHKKQSSWFAKISNVTVDKYPNREEVLKAERHAIITEKPLYNIRHKNGCLEKKQPEVVEPLEELTYYEQSKKQILKKVTLKPCYSFEEASLLFEDKPNAKIIQQMVDKGEIGYLELVNPRSPLKRTKKYVTGWQLIDYFENKGVRVS